MKERPILFNDDQVRAILDGRKTQTRRIVKPQPELCDKTGFVQADRNGKLWATGVGSTPRETRRNFARKKCHHGEPGDRLWVREAWAEVGSVDPGYLTYRATYPRCLQAGMENVPDDIRAVGYRWRPSIHMPRWASRITLEITGVRVERLHEISEADAEAEGCRGGHGAIPGYRYNATPAEHFYHVWESINGPGSWDENPWVWVVEFERVR